MRGAGRVFQPVARGRKTDLFAIMGKKSVRGGVDVHSATYSRSEDGDTTKSHIDYDPDGRTLQVADDLYAGDRHEFAFEWAEPDGPDADG